MCKSRKVLIQHLLNYGMDIHQMWNTLRYLEVSVTFLKMIGMENLMKKVMNEYTLDTPQEVKLKNV